ncbi:uncharacterized protein LOC112460404 [Temnothorax curvispinosus]|uniref:Uncharacterized protein LOC112460404 n=1 Tax=Temnothorax curvispinosus TaxID=300111 RepID=A0A6J1QJU5_9HYME|nr:uncharacterized protein LOC112460404 [Temnothorax curvispinosus]
MQHLHMLRDNDVKKAREIQRDREAFSLLHLTLGPVGTAITQKRPIGNVVGGRSLRQDAVVSSPFPQTSASLSSFSSFYFRRTLIFIQFYGLPNECEVSYSRRKFDGGSKYAFSWAELDSFPLYNSPSKQYRDVWHIPCFKCRR